MRSENFANYVRDSIPNPPVRIKIEVDGDYENPIILDQNTFSSIVPSSLKDYQWHGEDYIHEFEVDFEDSLKGIRGRCIVAVLEDDNMPIQSIENLVRTVTIDGEDYTLENRMILKINEIEKTSTVIEVGIDSGIDTRESTDTLVRSKSKISIHGIEFPDNIFPDFTSRNKKAKLQWPFPALLVADVFGLAVMISI